MTKALVLSAGSDDVKFLDDPGASRQRRNSRHHAGVFCYEADGDMGRRGGE